MSFAPSSMNDPGIATEAPALPPPAAAAATTTSVFVGSSPTTTVVSTPPTPTTSDPDDCKVLNELYLSTGGDYWLHHDGWLGGGFVGNGDCCGLVGVKCSGGRVVVISLTGNNMTGSLPGSLFRLDALRSLTISGNPGLTGGVPGSLFTMPNLAILDLSRNSLFNQLPDEFGSVSAPLTTLLLDDNRLSGPLPALYGPHFNTPPTPFACDLTNNLFTCADDSMQPSSGSALCRIDSITTCPGSGALSNASSPDTTTRNILIVTGCVAFSIVTAIIILCAYVSMRRARRFGGDGVSTVGYGESTMRSTVVDGEEGEGGGGGFDALSETQTLGRKWWNRTLEVDRVREADVAVARVVQLGMDYQVIEHAGSLLPSGTIVTVEAVSADGVCSGCRQDTGETVRFPTNILRPIHQFSKPDSMVVTVPMVSPRISADRVVK
ncbi:hypothetical protein HDV00_006902 [Rhizophlyctis rosea]|nr:hypothetical protein HDV00_006902 [Rhizophlyctis rosea]